MGLVNKTKLFENIGTATTTELLHTGSGILLGFSATWMAGTDEDGQINPLHESSIWVTLNDQFNKQILGTATGGIGVIDVCFVIAQGTFDWINPYTGSLIESINTLQQLKPSSNNKGISVFSGNLSMDYQMDSTNNQPQSMSISYTLIGFE